MTERRYSGPPLAAEQAIARHGSLAAAVEHSGLPKVDLQRAWKRICAAAEADDVTRPQCMPGQAPPCGTYAAYDRHLRYKEPVDQDCRLAAYNAGYGNRSRRRTAS